MTMTSLLLFLDPVSMAFIGQMALGGIVSIGLAAAARALQKKARTKNENEAYSWNATTTQRPAIPIEYAIGLVPVNGNVITANTTITNTTTELSWVMGSILTGLNQAEENIVVLQTKEQIAARLAFCDGPVQGLVAGKSRINDELVADLGEVTLTERRGTSNQTATPMPEHYEEPLDDEVLPGSPVTVPMPDKDYVGLVLEVSAKLGLYRYGESTGKKIVQIMGVKIEIREVGGAWHTLFNYYLIGNTTNPISWRFAANGSYPGGTPFTVVQGRQHEWRVTMTDLRSNANAPVSLWVTRFQELYSDTNAHTGLAHVEISGYATAKINGDLEFKGILQAQICESIAGGTFAWSDNPALASKFVATRPVIAGDGVGVPYAVDYYRGHEPAKLHTSDLAALEAWCNELVPDGAGGTQKRFRFNGRLSSQVECWENLAKIGAMCRANPYYWGNQIRWWIDKPTTPTHLFCDANTLRDGRSGRSSYRRESIDIRQRPSVIECQILHDAADYASVPVRVTDKTATTHHIERIDGEGITNVVQLTQFANYLFDRGRSVRYRCGWNTDTNGMDVMPGDVAYVQSDENGRAIGAKVSAVAGIAVTIDRPATLAVGITYKLVIQTVTASGKSVVVYTVQSAAGVTDSSEGYAVPVGTRLTLTAVPNPTPQAGDCCILAAEGKLDQVRILTVGRSGDHTVSFAAEEYSAASYARDNSAPDVDTEISLAAVNGVKKVWRPLTRQDLLTSLPDSQVFDGDDNDTIAVGGLVFSGNGKTTVSWSIKDAGECGWVRLAGMSTPIQANAAGTTKRYIFFNPAAADPTILQTTDLLTDLAGEAYYLLCENVAGVAYLRNGILIAAADIKLDGVEDGADVTRDHQADVVIDNATEGVKFVKAFHEYFQDPNGDAAERWIDYGAHGAELSIATGGISGANVLRIGSNSGNDEALLIYGQSVPFRPDAMYRVHCRVRRTAGAGTISVGVAGRNAADTAWVNKDGANLVTNQYWIACYNAGPTEWTEYTGYMRGVTATPSSQNYSPDPSEPMHLHTNVRWIRPMIRANYDDQAGSFEVDEVTVEPCSPPLFLSAYTAAAVSVATSETTLQTLTVATKGETILILYGSMVKGQLANETFLVKLYVDGLAVVTLSSVLAPGSSWTPVSSAIIQRPGRGTHTITLKAAVLTVGNTGLGQGNYIHIVGLT